MNARNVKLLLKHLLRAFLALCAVLSLPGTGIARSQSNELGLIYLTLKDIRELPESISAEFRNVTNYESFEKGIRPKVNSNCVAVALDSWGKLGFGDGPVTSEEKQFRWSEKPCDVVFKLMQKHPQVDVRLAEGDTCNVELKEWLAVVLFTNPKYVKALTREMHMVRQVPDGRFLQQNGEDRPLSWLTRNGVFIKRASDLLGSGWKYSVVCQPICVRHKRPAVEEEKKKDVPMSMPTESTMPPRLRGLWLAVEPSREADFGMNGYRHYRCSEEWLIRMSLSVGDSAAYAMGKQFPNTPRRSSTAMLRLDPDSLGRGPRNEVGAGFQIAGGWQPGIGFDLVEVYDRTYLKLATTRGETSMNRFKPWLVQAGSGIRVQPTFIGMNHFKALIHWDSICKKEVLFVNNTALLSGEPLR